MHRTWAKKTKNNRSCLVSSLWTVQFHPFGSVHLWISGHFRKLKVIGVLTFVLLGFQVKLVQWVWIGRSPDFEAPYIGGYLGLLNGEYRIGYITHRFDPFGSFLVRSQYWPLGLFCLLSFEERKGLQILFDLFHQRQSRHPCLIDITSDSLILAIMVRIRASRGVRTG